MRLMQLVMMLFVLVMSVVSVSCAVCTAQATRCDGNISQVCDARGHWRDMRNCDEVQFNDHVPGICQTVIDQGQEAHTCMPEEVIE